MMCSTQPDGVRARPYQDGPSLAVGWCSVQILRDVEVCVHGSSHQALVDMALMGG